MLKKLSLMSFLSVLSVLSLMSHKIAFLLYRSYLKFSDLYSSYLNFSDLKASKPAVRKLGRRR
ncbi:MAG: hypothetical protein LBP59_04555 [Planctomycetaceae bacterium]|nr:hypothetical protein [Planctomycetaceae bacterium]